MATEWGGEFAQLLDREGIGHGDKRPEDHGSFARIDSAIRTLKREIRMRCEDGVDWEAALPIALREYNSDANKTTGTTPKDVESNQEATIFHPQAGVAKHPAQSQGQCQKTGARRGGGRRSAHSVQKRAGTPGPKKAG
ncbi:MAG: hypothetical protein ACKPKO_43875, partial [Candidatus Fonsibacter sp.]